MNCCAIDLLDLRLLELPNGKVNFQQQIQQKPYLKLHLVKRRQTYCMTTLQPNLRHKQHVLGSAKRWSLGCVNSSPAVRGSQEAGVTQPSRAHLLADPRTVRVCSKNYSYLTDQIVTVCSCLLNHVVDSTSVFFTTSSHGRIHACLHASSWNHPF